MTPVRVTVGTYGPTHLCRESITVTGVTDRNRGHPNDRSGIGAGGMADS
jgi:hypothetical protein